MRLAVRLVLAAALLAALGFLFAGASPNRAPPSTPGTSAAEAGGGGLSSGSQCPAPQSAPVVDIVVQEPRVDYDFDHDASAIQDIASAINPDMGSESIVVRGLTVARYAVKTDLFSVRTPARSGQGWCTSPSRLVLTVGYPDPVTVYVESNYPVASCQHAAILEHENHHVEIHKQSLQDHLPLIRAAVSQSLADPSYPVWTQEPDEGNRLILKASEAVAETAMDDLAADRNARHAYLDRPQSIQGTLDECSSW
jgi:hypothetical protein